MHNTPDKKGGILSRIIAPARDFYNWMFHPNVDHHFTDPFWHQTRAKQIRKLEREIVMRYSRGNFCLQQGKYITREDMDEAQKALKEFVKYDDDKFLKQA